VAADADSTAPDATDSTARDAETLLQPTARDALSLAAGETDSTACDTETLLQPTACDARPSRRRRGK